jgi:hypothetical protein
MYLLRKTVGSSKIVVAVDEDAPENDATVPMVTRAEFEIVCCCISMYLFQQSGVLCERYTSTSSSLLPVSCA